MGRPEKALLAVPFGKRWRGMLGSYRGTIEKLLGLDHSSYLSSILQIIAAGHGFITQALVSLLDIAASFHSRPLNTCQQNRGGGGGRWRAPPRAQERFGSLFNINESLSEPFLYAVIWSEFPLTNSNKITLKYSKARVGSGSTGYERPFHSFSEARKALRESHI